MNLELVKLLEVPEGLTLEQALSHNDSSMERRLIAEQIIEDAGLGWLLNSQEKLELYPDDEESYQ